MKIILKAFWGFSWLYPRRTLSVSLAQIYLCFNLSAMCCENQLRSLYLKLTNINVFLGQPSLPISLKSFYKLSPYRANNECLYFLFKYPHTFSPRLKWKNEKKCQCRIGSDMIPQRTAMQRNPPKSNKLLNSWGKNQSMR